MLLEICLNCKNWFYQFSIFPLGILTFSLNWYVIESRKLFDLKNQIDKHGEIKNLKEKATNLLFLFVSIPDKDSKYYQFEEINSQVKIIRKYRTIYKILFPIFIIFLITTIILDETKIIT